MTGTVYRIFPYNKSAEPEEPGGVYYTRNSGAGRIDNIDLYTVFYAAGSPEAAVAEIFGRLPIWKPADFVHASGLPYAIASYHLGWAPKIEDERDVPVFDMDDIDALRKIGIQRPSSVVTRDRAITQTWARQIFELSTSPTSPHGFAGVSWWSYYDPPWKIYGFWQLHWDTATAVTYTVPEILTIDSRGVRVAAERIVRQID